MTVDSLFSVFTVVAAPEETLSETASRMRYNDVGSVPVLSAGKLVGILTERDLTRALADGIDSRTARVDEYMTPDPQVVEPDTDLKRAAHMMLTSGTRHLPVVEIDGRLLGMISMRDILANLL